MTRHFRNTRLATTLCCSGIVAAGFFFQIDILRLIVAAACIGLLVYHSAVCGSVVTATKLLFLNSSLLALVFLVLRETLIYAPRHLPQELWPWFYRTFRAMWLSECSAIILAMVAGGLAITEGAGKIGGEVLRKRFQWSIIAATSILLMINLIHFLRPVTCDDCFFPYGLPFTLFTEGGYGGGGGIVWIGLLADAALIPIFAAISVLVWGQTVRSAT